MRVNDIKKIECAYTLSFYPYTYLYFTCANIFIGFVFTVVFAFFCLAAKAAQHFNLQNSLLQTKPALVSQVICSHMAMFSGITLALITLSFLCTLLAMSTRIECALKRIIVSTLAFKLSIFCC